MQRHVELRKVPAGFLEPIAVILDINEDWKRVMSVIPKDILDDNFEPKYNIEHMRLIEQRAHTAKLKCARVLFDEWGSSGRKRPTLQNLLDVLAKAKMIRAAEDLAKMLNESPPPRPEIGPEAKVNTNVTSILNDTSGEQNIDNKKISNNCSRTNGTYNGICNHSAKNLDRSVNFLEFPPTQVIPNFEVMGHHSTEMIRDKDMMASKSNLIISNNCNKTNGTYNSICNNPAKRLDRSVNFLQFPPTQVIPNFEVMGHHSTEMIRDKDMMASKSNVIISNNCNGTTNRTCNGICNNPAKKLVRSVNFLEFPPTQVIPNFEVMDHHSTEMMQDKGMMASKRNPIEFSEKLPDQLPSEEYLPKFSSLMAKRKCYFTLNI